MKVGDKVGSFLENENWKLNVACWFINSQIHHHIITTKFTCGRRIQDKQSVCGSRNLAAIACYPSGVNCKCNRLIVLDINVDEDDEEKMNLMRMTMKNRRVWRIEVMVMGNKKSMMIVYIQHRMKIVIWEGLLTLIDHIYLQMI